MKEVNTSQTFKRRYLNAKSLSYFAVLLALVVILQLFGAVFKIGATQLSFVLVPIVISGMLLGTVASSLLGLVFGIIVYLQGLFGADVFTMILINDHPFLTLLICVGKGVACGFVSGLSFNLLKNKNRVVASFVSSALCPIVNTGLFILGSLFFVKDTISANFVPDGQTLIYFLIIGCAGVNFIIELFINLICAPAATRVTQIVEKKVRGSATSAKEKDDKECTVCKNCGAKYYNNENKCSNCGDNLE